MASDLVDRIQSHINMTGTVMRFPVSGESAVDEAETQIGVRIPVLLKRCYMEICNGGFGPGLGVIGVAGGYESPFGDLIRTYRQMNDTQIDLGGSWEPTMLPFCYWGGTILSCVNCGQRLQISTFEDGRIWLQNYTLNDFFEMWINGTDILANDPNTRIVEMDITNPFTGRRETMKARRRSEPGQEQR